MCCGRCLVFQHDEKQQVNSLTMNPRGATLAFGGDSKRVAVCDVRTGALVYEIKRDEAIRAVAIADATLDGEHDAGSIDGAMVPSGVEGDRS